MQKYSQLSLEHRYQIKALPDAGHNQSEIRTIGVHRSTINRELNRDVVANNDGKRPAAHRPSPSQQTDHCLTEVLKGQPRDHLPVNLGS